MGFSPHDLAILVEMKQQGLIPDRGAIIEIGAQQLTNSFLEGRSTIEGFGHLFGVTEPISLKPAEAVRRTAGGTEILDVSAPLRATSGFGWDLDMPPSTSTAVREPSHSI